MTWTWKNIHRKITIFRYNKHLKVLWATKNSQNSILNLTNAPLIFNDFTAKVLIFSAKGLNFAAQVKNNVKTSCKVFVAKTFKVNVMKLRFKFHCNWQNSYLLSKYSKFVIQELPELLLCNESGNLADVNNWLLGTLDTLGMLGAWPLILYLLIFSTMVLTARRAVIQARVTRKPRYTGVHSNPQPRLMMPRSAWHANVWGRT